MKERRDPSDQDDRSSLFAGAWTARPVGCHPDGSDLYDVGEGTHCSRFIRPDEPRPAFREQERAQRVPDLVFQAGLKLLKVQAINTLDRGSVQYFETQNGLFGGTTIALRRIDAIRLPRIRRVVVARQGTTAEFILGGAQPTGDDSHVSVAADPVETRPMTVRSR